MKCPLCDYVCANENPDLKVHIKRRHVPHMGSEEAMSAFKCPECGIIATSKRDLRQHLKFHSKGPELKLFCNVRTELVMTLLAAGLCSTSNSTTRGLK